MLGCPTFNGYKMTNIDERLYQKLNNYSQEHRTLGRLASVPVAVLNVGMHIGETLIQPIAHLAVAAFHAIGSLFSENCSFKRAIQHFDFCINGILVIPYKISVMAPIRLSYQVFAGIYKPHEVQPADYRHPTFAPIANAPLAH